MAVNRGKRNGEKGFWNWTERKREKEWVRRGFSSKMMGSNIALEFEGEVPQLAGRIRRLPSPSIFFIIVRRDCVYVRLGVSGNVSWKKQTYLAAEDPSPRTVPSDAISRLTACIKWKTFLEVQRVSMRTLVHIHRYMSIDIYTHICTRIYTLSCNTYKPGLYLFPLRGESSKCLLLFFKLEHSQPHVYISHPSLVI